MTCYACWTPITCDDRRIHIHIHTVFWSRSEHQQNDLAEAFMWPQSISVTVRSWETQSFTVTLGTSYLYCRWHGNLVGDQAAQGAGHAAVCMNTINTCTVCNVLYALKTPAPRYSTRFPCPWQYLKNTALHMFCCHRWHWYNTAATADTADTTATTVTADTADTDTTGGATQTLMQHVPMLVSALLLPWTTVVPCAVVTVRWIELFVTVNSSWILVVTCCDWCDWWWCRRCRRCAAQVLWCTRLAG